jgi:hypothetical protein
MACALMIAIASEASEALADLDEFWKVMIEKSGISVWETMSQGERTVTFISKLADDQKPAEAG